MSKRNPPIREITGAAFRPAGMFLGGLTATGRFIRGGKRAGERVGHTLERWDQGIKMKQAGRMPERPVRMPEASYRAEAEEREPMIVHNPKGDERPGWMPHGKFLKELRRLGWTKAEIAALMEHGGQASAYWQEYLHRLEMMRRNPDGDGIGANIPTGLGIGLGIAAVDLVVSTLKKRGGRGKKGAMSKKNPVGMTEVTSTLGRRLVGPQSNPKDTQAWEHRGIVVFPAGPNSSGIHWTANAHTGYILKADTKQSMRDLIARELKRRKNPGPAAVYTVPQGYIEITPGGYSVMRNPDDDGGISGPSCPTCGAQFAPGTSGAGQCGGCGDMISVPITQLRNSGDGVFHAEATGQRMQSNPRRKRRR